MAGKLRHWLLLFQEVRETKTNLLREVFGAQKEAQQASDNHGQHWQDEEAVLLAHIFNTTPHLTQRHGDTSTLTAHSINYQTPWPEHTNVLRGQKQTDRQRTKE